MRQIEILKQMGFGGAHIHARSGLVTTYLGAEFMELVKICVKKMKEEGMLAWLYDEDDCPSGFAGRLVTQEKAYRKRWLVFSPVVRDDLKYRKPEGVKAGCGAEEGFLLACYDVELDADGYLKSYRMIDKDQPARYDKWYAYLEVEGYYVNTLDPKAIDRFIEITYERYYETVSEEFGSTVPAIFTDEPQHARKTCLKYAGKKEAVILPWTDDLPETYGRVYQGEDLLAGIPELIWERADRKPSVLRYHYHDHVCERFAGTFADRIGKWCAEHNIALTGHLMCEGDLGGQTCFVGEAMRSYRNFHLPGVDVLCASFEYTTLKQAQSAMHQYGREGMISELYGVTNWDFDFRGHKLHGDWQAALGVTVRVPHLSWVSMKRRAKRDYPAPISYQSPWWDRYPVVEDHFARVNTAMTRGKALVKVGVIHPIESYWLQWGPSDQTGVRRGDMERDFQQLAAWLLFGGIDFDYISESLLPQLCPLSEDKREVSGKQFQAGEMLYDVILVAGCDTLRRTTLERLEDFADRGGQVIFAGKLPYMEDAVLSDRAAVLAQRKEVSCIPFARGEILHALEPVRLVSIRNENGTMTENLLHRIRQDGNGRWKVTLYNTSNGRKEEIDHCVRGNRTEIHARLYAYDSLLLWLEEADTEYGGTHIPEATVNQMPGRPIKFPAAVPYTLSEPNVLLLDQAEYAVDDGPWEQGNGEDGVEEILRIHNLCRERFGWPKIVTQPWRMPKEKDVHTIHLRWHIWSEIACSGVMLAIEDARKVALRWNGREVPVKITGWYVDKAIETIALPDLVPGENILEAAVPFGSDDELEWAYLLGNFGVRVSGRKACVTAPDIRLEQQEEKGEKTYVDAESKK